MFFSMACSLIGAVWSARRYFGHGKNFNKRVTYSSGLLFGAETERMELFRVIVEPYHLRPCGAGQYDRHLRKWESWRSCLPSIWERLWKKFWQHPFNDSRSFKNAHTFVFTIPLTCRECVFFKRKKTSSWECRYVCTVSHVFYKNFVAHLQSYFQVALWNIARSWQVIFRLIFLWTVPCFFMLFDAA